MSVTPEIEAEILRAHRANPKRFSPFKVAKQVGATTSEVIATVNRHRETPVQYDGRIKRPELETFIMASRRVTDSGWNNEDDGVKEARARFCAGTHDMTTHRDGLWLHLCSIPLVRHRKPRPTYFNLGAS